MPAIYPSAYNLIKIFRLFICYFLVVQVAIHLCCLKSGISEKRKYADTANGTIKKGNANAETRTSHSEIMKEEANDKQADNNAGQAINNTASMPGNKQDAHDLPAKVPVNFSLLEHLVSCVIIRSTHQGLESAATILEQLEQSPNQSMKQLQHLTGLSHSGIGKRIMSMKRYGLIFRGPRRQLLLTDKDKQMLDQCRRR